MLWFNKEKDKEQEENKYVTKEDLKLILEKVEKVVDGFNKNTETIIGRIQTLELKLKKLYNYYQGNSGLEDKITLLDDKVTSQEEDNKSLMQIILKLNESVDLIHTSQKQLKNKPATETISTDDEAIQDLEDRFQSLQEKLDISVDVLLEKITEKEVETAQLPKELLGDKCPFKRKKGYCEIWATRKDKSDALLYCQPCLKSLEFKEKGIS